MESSDDIAEQQVRLIASEEPLLEKEQYNAQYPLRSSARTRKKTWMLFPLLFILFGAVIVLVATNAYTLTSVLHKAPYQRQLATCGSTVEEAQAKRCQFSVFFMDWVPEPCFDGALEAEYRSVRNWTWFGDKDGVERIESPGDLSMRSSAYSTKEDHGLHCLFSFRKIYQELMHPQGLPSDMLGYNHILHCTHLLEDFIYGEPLDGKSIGTELTIGLKDCWV